MSYHEQRLALREIPSNYARARSKSAAAMGYRSASVDSHDVSWTTLTIKQIVLVKQHFSREFPQVATTIASYKCVDQGEEGACSFVGFINCAQLSGRDISKVRRNWKKMWGRRETMEDIGQMLDELGSRLKFGPFRYIPICGVDENYFNKSIWKPAATRHHFGLPPEPKNTKEKREDEYLKAPMVYENGRLIETLLDSGIPVEVNAFEHSRTAIAYNDEHILFADNWHPTAGLKSAQKCDPTGKFLGGGGGAGKRIELFAASFSRVNKWHVYSMMRDIVYFPRNGGLTPPLQGAPNKTRAKPVRAPNAPKKSKPVQSRSRARSSRQIIPKDFSQWSRSELQTAVRGGQLKQYGVHVNSSSDAIRRALRKNRP